MAKARRKRNSYTEDRRASILAAARKGNLTALQVEKKFGVAPVTYYSWRKKQGLTRPRGQSAGVVAGALGDLSQQVQTEVRAKVRQVLPGIVRREVSGYLDMLFRGAGGWARKV